MDDNISITFLGGINEVGGNTVLLEDFTYDLKIFLDNRIKIGKYYGHFEPDQHPSST